MSEHKVYFALKASFEDDVERLLVFLNKSPIKKLIPSMIGCNKKPMSVYQVFRVRYAYCVFRLLTEEFGENFALRWFSRPNIFLEQRTPILAIRHYSPEKLSHVLQAAMACIQSAHGILP
ncbi:MAG: hypothetical protein Q7S81_00755 [bacterium]|nr:hypothetical protein [bacterium]